MKILFIFLDGVGLGVDDPGINPFARAHMPALTGLLGGRRLLADSAPYEGERGSLFALDACLGVAGLPQSATGQAVLSTGVNVPARLGYHYGPKPNPETAAFLETGGVFVEVTRRGKRVGMVNAYPPGYFHGIDSGKRIYSSFPLAITRSGLPLLSADDLLAGRALSADFTGQGWVERLGYPDFPLLSPREAGVRMAELTRDRDLAFFEYWLSDYAGHGQDMAAAVALMETFDAVLAGLLDALDDECLLLLTSDHGNLEDLGTRRHTASPVPLLLVGDLAARRQFARINDLTGVAPLISDLLA